MIELDDDLALEIHLMSAGRLQLFDTRASLRDRTSRLLVRLDDGRELRLREFGTRQRAWVKLLRAADARRRGDDRRARARGLARSAAVRRAARTQPRPLYALLRDQHVIAGIGRSWVDEILHTAMMSPFKRGSDLDDDEAERLREATVAASSATRSPTTRSALTLPIPDKLPMPLTVHRRNGEPCPRCGDRLEAVFYEDYVMCYCPTCQTEGKLLKDRRLSRLLK